MCVSTLVSLCVKSAIIQIEYPSWEPIFRVPSCRRRRPVPSPIRSAATHFSPSIRSDLFSVWSVRPHHRSTRPDPLLQTRCGTRSVVRTRSGSHASFCLPRSVRSALSLEICHRRPDLLVKELHRLQQRTDLLQSARLQPRSGPFVPICSDQPRSKFNIRHFRSCRPAVPDSSLPLRSDPLAACRSRSVTSVNDCSGLPDLFVCLCLR